LGIVLPALGLTVQRSSWLIWMFLLAAGGQALQALGLFIAGLLGVAQASGGLEHSWEGWGQGLALSIAGLGGLASLVGYVLFLGIAGRTLRSSQD